MNCKLVAITSTSIILLSVVSYFGYKFYIDYTAPPRTKVEEEQVTEEVTKKKKKFFEKGQATK